MIGESTPPQGTLEETEAGGRDRHARSILATREALAADLEAVGAPQLGAAGHDPGNGIGRGTATHSGTRFQDQGPIPGTKLHAIDRQEVSALQETLRGLPGVDLDDLPPHLAPPQRSS